MTTVFLIRHAEAEGNAYRRLHGWYNSRVTVNGYRQIAALRKRLERERIDAVYASDLYRTVQTAKAAAEPHGLEIRRDWRFREVNFGTWEDLPFGWLEHFERERMLGFMGPLSEWCVEGSETYAQYTSRFLEALREAAEENEGRTIAITSHGTVLRTVQQILLGSEDVPYCDNTAVSKLVYQNGSWAIAYLNDASHVPEDISTFASQKWWRRDADRGDYNLWFSPQGEGKYHAMLGDEQIGTFCFDGAAGEIFDISLLPQYCGMALGGQLFGQIVSDLRKAGTQQAFVRLPSGHRAEHFFRECGFEGQDDGLWTAEISV